MAKFRTASDLVGVSFFVRDASGLHAINAPRIRTASGLVNLFGEGGGSGGGTTNFTAKPDKDSVYGAIDRKFAAPVTSNAVTVNVFGGQAPYTYSWTADEGVVAVNPTSATTAFRKSLGAGDSVSANGICTVTDSAGHTTSTSNVAIQLDNYSSGTNFS